MAGRRCQTSYPLSLAIQSIHYTSFHLQIQPHGSPEKLAFGIARKAPMAVTDHANRFRPTAPQSVGSSSQGQLSSGDSRRPLDSSSSHISEPPMVPVDNPPLSSPREAALPPRQPSLKEEQPPMGEILCSKKSIQVEARPLEDSRFRLKVWNSLRA